VSTASVHQSRPWAFTLIPALERSTELAGKTRSLDFRQRFRSATDPCDPHTPGPDLGLRVSGGVSGTEYEVYQRLLAHTGFMPKGRVVVVPDMVWSSTEERPPFVCDTETLLIRLHERDATDQTCLVFDGSSDSLFVYETGEVLLLDHDQRLFWAQSKVRSWP